jgi:hypothetical protein
MNMKVLNGERALMIVGSLVTLLSTHTARDDGVTAVCTDNASNELSVLNELHTFSLPRQTKLTIIRIPRIPHTANLTVGDSLTESSGTRRRDIRKILAALPDYICAPFNDIRRGQEKL